MNQVIIENCSAATLNNYYRIMRGRYVITPNGREYKKVVQSAISHITPTKEILKINIDVFFNNKKKRDVDNVLKPLLDALKGFVYDDDSQIIELNVKKYIGQSSNKIVISWEVVPPDENMQ